MTISKDNINNVLDSIDLTNLAQYLRNFAPLEFFPKGHPIDYKSLALLDDIEKYLSHADKSIFSIVMGYGDFLKFAWIAFCISLKNLHTNKICIGYGLLAYFSANLGVAHHPEDIVKCKFIRLRSFGFLENDFYNYLEELENMGNINLSADDAIAMAFMSDVYSTETVQCPEKWFQELRKSVREHENDYAHLTKQQIIDNGIDVHQNLKIYIVQKLSAFFA